jgi:hypothetical protein
METAEAVQITSLPFYTQLKQGVNENGKKLFSTNNRVLRIQMWRKQ